MKGNYIQNELFWEVELKGESWSQGSTISGLLSATNKGQNQVDLKNTSVKLGFGQIKDFQSQKHAALKNEFSKSFNPELTLLSGQKETLPFSFELAKNSPITDKKSSYYLSYGINGEGGHLQINITPLVIFLKITELLGNFYRFKLKEIKNSKAGIEFKFIPPASRDLANVEGLLLTMLMIEENLSLNFQFNTRKLNLASIGVTPASIELRTFPLIMAPKDYLLGKDLYNQDLLLKKMGEILEQIRMKSLI